MGCYFLPFSNILLTCTTYYVNKLQNQVCLKNKIKLCTLDMLTALIHWYTQTLHSCCVASVVLSARRFFPVPSPSS